MPTSSTTRALSALVLSLSVASIALHAVPVSLSSPLGLPDRDVVRNPYGASTGNAGSSFSPQSSSIVGPNLGIGTSFAPGLSMGGGGGGGGVVPGFSAPAAGSGGFATSPGSGSAPSTILSPGGSNNGNSSSSNAGGSSPSYGSSSNSPTILSVVAVPSVPDGGSSAVMLGAGLLAVLGLRRRLAATKS